MDAATRSRSASKKLLEEEEFCTQVIREERAALAAATDAANKRNSLAGRQADDHSIEDQERILGHRKLLASAEAKLERFRKSRTADSDSVMPRNLSPADSGRSSGRSSPAGSMSSILENLSDDVVNAKIPRDLSPADVERSRSEAKSPHLSSIVEKASLDTINTPAPRDMLERERRDERGTSLSSIVENTPVELIESPAPRDLSPSNKDHMRGRAKSAERKSLTSITEKASETEVIDPMPRDLPAPAEGRRRVSSQDRKTPVLAAVTERASTDTVEVSAPRDLQPEDVGKGRAHSHELHLATVSERLSLDTVETIAPRDLSPLRKPPPDLTVIVDKKGQVDVPVASPLDRSGSASRVSMSSIPEDDGDEITPSGLAPVPVIAVGSRSEGQPCSYEDLAEGGGARLGISLDRGLALDLEGGGPELQLTSTLPLEPNEEQEQDEQDEEEEEEEEAIVPRREVSHVTMRVLAGRDLAKDNTYIKASLGKSQTWLGEVADSRDPEWDDLFVLSVMEKSARHVRLEMLSSRGPQPGLKDDVYGKSLVPIATLISQAEGGEERWLPFKQGVETCGEVLIGVTVSYRSPDDDVLVEEDEEEEEPEEQAVSVPLGHKLGIGVKRDDSPSTFLNLAIVKGRNIFGERLFVKVISGGQTWFTMWGKKHPERQQEVMWKIDFVFDMNKAADEFRFELWQAADENSVEEDTCIDSTTIATSTLTGLQPHENLWAEILRGTPERLAGKILLRASTEGDVIMPGDDELETPAPEPPTRKFSVSARMSGGSGVERPVSARSNISDVSRGSKGSRTYTNAKQELEADLELQEQRVNHCSQVVSDLERMGAGQDEIEQARLEMENSQRKMDMIRLSLQGLEASHAQPSSTRSKSNPVPRPPLTRRSSTSFMRSVIHTKTDTGVISESGVEGEERELDGAGDEPGKTLQELVAEVYDDIYDSVAFMVYRRSTTADIKATEMRAVELEKSGYTGEVESSSQGGDSDSQEDMIDYSMIERVGQLRVSISQARHLNRYLGHGKVAANMDTYCQIVVGTEEQFTNLVNNNPNPYFETGFEFDDVSSYDTVVVSMWCRRPKQDELIGTAVFSLQPMPSGANFEGWFYLTRGRLARHALDPRVGLTDEQIWRIPKGMIVNLLISYRYDLTEEEYFRLMVGNSDAVEPPRSTLSQMQRESSLTDVVQERATEPLPLNEKVGRAAETQRSETGMKLAYLEMCDSLRIRPNSHVAAMLPGEDACDAEEYNLANNYLGDLGVKALLEVIKHNKNLCTLVLKGNGLHNRGAEYLAKAFAGHPNLATLDVRNNSISDGGAQHLVRLLQETPTLTTLQFDHNPISRRDPHWEMRLLQVQEANLTAVLDAS